MQAIIDFAKKTHNSLTGGGDNTDSTGSRENEYRGSRRWRGLKPAVEVFHHKPRVWDEGFQKFLIKYGMLNHVVYDVFIKGGADDEDGDGLRNSSRFGDDLETFTKEGLKFSYINKKKERKMEYDFSDQYHIVANIVASPHSFFMSEDNWFGFIALSNDKKELVIIFRGTLTTREWIENASCFMVKLGGEPPEQGWDALWNRKDIMVHQGFQQLYNEKAVNEADPADVKECPKETVYRVIEENKGTLEKITVVGHSLGGAMAQLAGFDIVHNGITGDIPVTVIAFAPPKVGNAAVAARAHELFPKLAVLRVRNPEDTVCNLPPDWVWSPTTGGFRHMGEELNISNKHLRAELITTEAGANHNLQMYLHNIDPSRDPALMNKNGNPLRDDYILKNHITPYWHTQTWPRTIYHS